MFGINDPSALLRPWRNLQQFSEELYAMFSKGARAGETPVATRPRAESSEPERRKFADENPAKADLNAVRKVRLEAARAREATPEPAKGGSHVPRPRTQPTSEEGASRPAPQAVTPQPIPELGPQPSSRKKEYPRARVERATDRSQPPDDARRPVSDQTDHSAPVPESLTIPERRHRPEPARARPPAAQTESANFTKKVIEPRVVDRKKPEESEKEEPSRIRRYEKFAPKPPLDIGNFATFTPSGGGGTTTFMGKVASGSGNTYEVTLYQNGPHADPDATTVEVTIPQISESETIAPGTWLSCIFQFTDPDNGDITFSCQPPIWMS